MNLSWRVFRGMISLKVAVAQPAIDVLIKDLKALLDVLYLSQEGQKRRAAWLETSKHC